jgi:hypothetical protein
MSHFAKIDSDNIVENVIVAEQDFINSGLIGDAFLWIQTSYNDNFRGKYAATGDTWDKVNEVFISPQPHPSWILNTDYQWESPIAKLTDDKTYGWDEDTLSWLESTEDTVSWIESTTET